MRYFERNEFVSGNTLHGGVPGGPDGTREESENPSFICLKSKGGRVARQKRQANHLDKPSGISLRASKNTRS
ncbi:MAG TPA: hypothetical protein VEO75_00715, partial [Nitrososphaerales archaeon]|nr:hypothetical protein [Nitrososphaerales archaeon]